MAPLRVSSARTVTEPGSGAGAAIRRHWWVLAQAVVVVAGLAVLVESRTPTTYTATVVVLPAASAAADSTILPALVLGGQAELVRDDETLAMAAEALGRPIGLVTVEAGEVELDVHVEADDRAQAVEGANAVAAAYLERRAEATAAARAEARESLDAEQAEVERQLDALTGTEAADPDVELRRAVLRAQLQEVVDEQRMLRVGAAEAEEGEVVAAATGAKENGPELAEAGALGALLGLALGSALVSLRLHTDRRVRTIADADAAAEGVDVAGVVRHGELLAVAALAPGPGTRPPSAAVPDGLHALGAVLLSDAERLRSVLVTSPGEDRRVEALAIGLEVVLSAGDAGGVSVRRAMPATSGSALEGAASADVVLVLVDLGVTEQAALRRALRALRRVDADVRLVAID